MCLSIPGKIVDIYETEGIMMGKINFDGVTRESCLAYVPEAQVGDYVLVHVGFALNLLSEEEAQETIDLFKQMAEAGLLDDDDFPVQENPS
jgi:hydrogenase expression/formation protein HypC